MTTTAPVPSPSLPVDETRVESFVGQLLTDFAGAASTAMTVIGDRLGLYRAMTGAGPLTAAKLAAATGVNERLVTEWLAAQTVSGYVVHSPDENTYELPAEHAMALSLPDSPAYVVAAAEIIAGQYLTLDHLEDAFRGDGGIDYRVFPPSLYRGTERYFSTAYRHELAERWSAAVPGLVERPEAGARVADVGCGHGVGTVLMAQRWPASTFVGVDLHGPSIAAARANAVSTTPSRPRCARPAR